MVTLQLEGLKKYEVTPTLWIRKVRITGLINVFLEMSLLVLLKLDKIFNRWATINNNNVGLHKCEDLILFGLIFWFLVKKWNTLRPI